MPMYLDGVFPETKLHKDMQDFLRACNLRKNQEGVQRRAIIVQLITAITRFLDGSPIREVDYKSLRSCTQTQRIIDDKDNKGELPLNYRKADELAQRNAFAQHQVEVLGANFFSQVNNAQANQNRNNVIDHQQARLQSNRYLGGRR